jgi:hypothetical protein
MGTTIYRGFVITPSLGGYNTYEFYLDIEDTNPGIGISVEDCEAQIDEILKLEL